MNKKLLPLLFIVVGLLGSSLSASAQQVISVQSPDEAREELNSIRLQLRGYDFRSKFNDRPEFYLSDARKLRYVRDDLLDELEALSDDLDQLEDANDILDEMNTRHDHGDGYSQAVGATDRLHTHVYPGVGGGIYSHAHRQTSSGTSVLLDNPRPALPDSRIFMSQYVALVNQFNAQKSVFMDKLVDFEEQVRYAKRKYRRGLGAEYVIQKESFAPTTWEVWWYNDRAPSYKRWRYDVSPEEREEREERRKQREKEEKVRLGTDIVRGIIRMLEKN